jgi:hypothetical protein
VTNRSNRWHPHSSQRKEHDARESQDYVRELRISYTQPAGEFLERTKPTTDIYF